MCSFMKYILLLLVKQMSQWQLACMFYRYLLDLCWLYELCAAQGAMFKY